MRLRVRLRRVKAGLLSQGAVAAAGLLLITFHLACLAVPAAHAGLAMWSLCMIGFLVGGRGGRHWTRASILLTRAIVKVPVESHHGM